MARRTESRRPNQQRTPSAPPLPPSAPPLPQTIDDASQPAGPTLPIACIGASAGGLEAFSQLLGALQGPPGMALILVQHLAPQHESALPALLARQTRLPVLQAAEGMRIEADHVYVVPPNVQMRVDAGVLHLESRPLDRTQHTPIDFFLRSLASYAGERAIAVIMSGTASDGASGIRDVKAMGGIAIAQRADSARYDGMPRAAVATGLVDLVLSPAEIAAELVRIGRHPYVRSSAAEEVEAGRQDEVGLRNEHLQRIFTLLRGVSGVDFRHYKLPTIQRRLLRRMVLHKLTRVEDYVRFLTDTPAEVQALYRDILIHVTRFFRDAETFGYLSGQILPRILASQKAGDPIRAWVCGCSTGEEVYSLAIVLLEALGDQTDPTPIQIFATDISETAIEQARSGVYPESIAADVSPERLRRFFTRTDGSYRINKNVRDVCVFARQDVTRDPPFSKLDLILCRNVLIYLGATLQKKLMSVFHYGLKADRFLILGQAESIGSHDDLFETEDRKHRIFLKRPADRAAPMTFPAAYIERPQERASQAGTVPLDTASIAHEANRVLLERYAPPGVVVDANFQITQFRGHTGPYLEPSPGDPSFSLFKMVREGMLNGLRSALHAASKTNASVRREGLRVRQDGVWHEVAIEVIPISAQDRPHYLVLFESLRSVTAKRPSSGKARGPVRSAARTSRAAEDERLQQELAASRDYLQSIIQELEAANEELQAANEEVLSSNEELQSTNEELDTAKEELHSTNEELNTVNEELHGRNEELSRVNADLVNLLGSVQIAIVIVATDLRIRRFTPMAERVLNLISSDIGRPIGHIKPNIDCPDLEQRISEVIDTVSVYEREVRDVQGNWYSLRIRPYKNIQNRIDGAVLSLFDVTVAKRHELDQRAAREYAEAIVDTVRDGLVVLDADLRIQSVNPAFSRIFAIPEREATGKLLFELTNGEWDIPPLRSELHKVLTEAPRVDGFAFEHRFARLGARRLMINARRIDGDTDRTAQVLLAIADVTDDERLASPRSG